MKNSIYGFLLCLLFIFTSGSSSERPLYEYGTGFFITDSGYIATAGHIIPTTTKTIYVQYKKQVYLAKLICCDRAKDVAIIKINGNEKFPYIILQVNMVKNEPVFLLGYPDVDRFGYGIKVSYGGVDDYRSCYFHTLYLKVFPGNSGGPVINNMGECLGVLVSEYIGSNLSEMANSSSVVLLAEQEHINIKIHNQVTSLVYTNIPPTLVQKMSAVVVPVWIK